MSLVMIEVEIVEPFVELTMIVNENRREDNYLRLLPIIKGCCQLLTAVAEYKWLLPGINGFCQLFKAVAGY